MIQILLETEITRFNILLNQENRVHVKRTIHSVVDPNNGMGYH